MAVKHIVHRTGFIQSVLAPATTILYVDQEFLSIIAAVVNFTAGDYFYMSIEEDELYEEVKVTNSTGAYLVIQRGTPAQTFSFAASYNTDLTTREVKELAAGLAPVSPVHFTTTGGVTVTDKGGGNFEIGMPIPIIVGTTGIEVAQAFPNYTVAADLSTGCCAEDGTVGGGVSATYTFVGGGITAVSTAGAEVVINTPSPNFTGSGVTISGAWPNIDFAVTTGAAGTVQSVGVTNGLTLTGSPNINPVLGVAATGVTAGNYGGLNFNIRGQLTSVDVGFNPVSAIEVDPTSGLTAVRVGGVVTLDIASAAEGIVGVVALADADDPLDVDNVSTAVTPKLLVNVLSDIALTNDVGGQTYANESAGDYTNVVSTSSITLSLLAGEKALVFIDVTIKDTADTDPVEYALAAFSLAGAALIYGNRKVKQCQQSIMFSITGPFADSLAVRTTALVSGENVVSQSAHALVL